MVDYELNGWLTLLIGKGIAYNGTSLWIQTERSTLAQANVNGPALE